LRITQKFLNTLEAFENTLPQMNSNKYYKIFSKLLLAILTG